MEEQNIQEPEKVITGDTAKESLARSIQGQNFKTDSRATNEQSKPFNPYSFLKEGRVPSANDMLEYHMQNNVNYIPDWDGFINDNPSIAKTYGDETLGMLKQVVDQSIRDYAHGYFELDNTKLPDNQYNRLRYRDVKPERFTKAKLRVDGNPLFFEGPMRFQHTTPDQIAEKNSFAIDKNNRPVDVYDLINNSFRNRLKLEPVTGDNGEVLSYVWKELGDDEFVQGNQLRTYMGPRSVDDSNGLNAFSRGLTSALVGKTVQGVGWMIGNTVDLAEWSFGLDNSKWADDFENTTSMFGGYMTHQNVSESKRPFQNWKSFWFSAGDGTGQMLQMVGTSYLTGGASALLGAGKAGVSIASQIGGLALAASSKGAIMKNEFLAKGMGEGEASAISLGMAASTALIEKVIGPNVLLDPMKNSFTRNKMVDFMAKNIISDKFIKAGEKTKMAMIKETTGRFFDKMDKYAVTKGFAASIDETLEEPAEQVLDNFIMYTSNAIAKHNYGKKANELKKSIVDELKDSNGNTVGYVLENNGVRRNITVEEKRKIDTYASEGYFNDAEITMEGAWEEGLLAGITAFPMGISTHYTARNDSYFDKGDIYDLAAQIKKGEIKRADVEYTLNELEKQGRIPSRKLDVNGNPVPTEEASAFGIYKASVMNEIDANIAIMNKHGLTTSDAIRSMAGSSGMNRFILHGALGAANEIEEINLAKQELETTGKITTKTVVKEGDTVDSLEKKLEDAKKRLEYFSKPSQNKVEIGNELITPTASEAAIDYFLQESMLYKNASRSIKQKLVQEAQSGKIDPRAAKKMMQNKNGSMERMVAGNMELFIKSGLDKNPVRTFESNAKSIDAIRESKEQEFLRKRQAEDEAMNESNNLIADFNKKMPRFKGITSEVVKSINDEVLSSFNNEMKIINEKYEALNSQLNESDNDYSKQKETLDKNKSDEIDLLTKKTESLTVSRTKAEEQKSRINSVSEIIGELESLSSKVNATGVTESVKGDVQAIMDELNTIDSDNLAQTDVDLFEQLNSAMYNLENTPIVNRSISKDENGNIIAPAITQEEKSQIMASAISEHFLNPSSLSILDAVTSKLENGEEVELNDDEIDLLKSLVSDTKKSAEYLYFNKSFFQRQIESDKKAKQYSKLNNRTRISDDEYKMATDIINQRLEQLNSIADKIVPSALTRENQRFAINAIHVNMLLNSINVMTGAPGISEIINEGMNDAGSDTRIALAQVLDDINKSGVSTKDISSLLDLIEVYKAETNPSARALMEMALTKAEKIVLNFQDIFYKVHNGNTENLMTDVLKAIEKHQDNNSPMSLDLEYGYIRNNDLIFSTFEGEGRVVLRDGRYVYEVSGKDAGTTDLSVISMLNNIFQWSTINSNAAYDILRQEYESRLNTEGAIIPPATFEQQQAIMLVAAHILNPDNRYFIDVMKENAVKSMTEETFINNLIYVRGFAGAGKTSIITNSAVTLADKLSDKPTGKKKVVIVAPSIEVGRLSFKTLSAINENDESSIITYHELMTGKKQVPVDTDVLVMDESTLLSEADIIAIKSKITDENGNVNGNYAVVALGDESQTKNIETNISQPIRRVGKRTIPIIEQHRSSIRSIKNFQETMVSMISGNTVTMPALEFIDVDGIRYGGEYVDGADDTAIIEKFLNDNDPEAILVVESQAKAESLRKKYNRKVYATEFSTAEENSLCVSGLSNKRVYVAIDLSTMRQIQSPIPNALLTAASRAVEYLAVWSNEGVSNKGRGTIAGLTEYFQSKNREGYTAELNEAIFRIKALQNEANTNEGLPFAQPDLTHINEFGEISSETVDTEQRNTPLSTSSQGLRHVVSKVKWFTSKISRTEKRDENSLSASAIVNDVEDSDEIKSKAGVLRRIIKSIVNGFDAISESDIDAIEQFNASNPDEALNSPMAKFRMLVGKVVLAGIKMDNTIIKTPIIQGRLMVNGEETTVTGSPLGIRVLGEIDGRPVVNIIHLSIPGDTETAQNQSDLLNQIIEGSVSPAQLMDGILNGTMNGSQAEKLMKYLSLYKSLIESVSEDGKTPIVAGVEVVVAARESRNNDHFINGRFVIPSSFISSMQHIFNAKMGIVSEPVEVAPKEALTVSINDRRMNQKEYAQYSQKNGKRLKAGSFISYNEADEIKTSFVSDFFMRYENGVGTPMVILSNGEEIAISSLSVLESYASSIDMHERLISDDKRYVGGYTIPSNLIGTSEEKTYRELRFHLMDVLTEMEPYGKLTRKYVESYKTPWGNTVEHAIVYEVSDDIMNEALKRSGIKKPKWINEAKVIGIQGVPFVGQYRKSNSVLFARGENQKQNDIVASFIKDNGQPNKWNQQTLDRFNELVDDIVADSFSAKEIKEYVHFISQVKQQEVIMNGFDHSYALHSDFNPERNFVTLLDVIGNKGALEIDVTLNTHWISTEENRMNNTRSEFKPVFTVFVTDKYGKQFPLRVFTKRVEQSDKSEFSKSLKEGLAFFEQTTNKEDFSYSDFDSTDISKFIKNNAKIFIDKIKGLNNEQIPVSVLKHIEIASDGIHVNVKFADAEGDNNFDRYVNALKNIISDIESGNEFFDSMYVPFKTKKTTGNKEIITEEGLSDVLTLLDENNDSNGYFGMNGMVVSLPQINMSTNEEYQQNQDAAYFESNLDDIDEKRGTNPRMLISVDEANQLISSILGDEFIAKNGDLINPDLLNPITGIPLLGMAYNGQIRLRGFGGYVDYYTARHEAMHIITRSILNEKSRKKLVEEVQQNYPGQNPYEIISKLYETPNKGKTSFIKKALAFIKHMLYRMGLYSYNLTSLFYAADSGFFSNSHVGFSEIVDEKKYDKYGDITRLVEIFGSDYYLKDFLQDKIKGAFRKRLFINRYHGRAGENLGTAIKGMINLWNQDYRKQNYKAGQGSEMDKYSHAELGELEVNFPSDSSNTELSTKMVKEMNADDYMYLKSLPKTEDVKKAINAYLRYNISHSSGAIVKMLIQQILPGVDIDEQIKFVKDEKARLRDSNGVNSSGVIRADDSNEKNDFRMNLAPFIKFVLSSIPYYDNITFSGANNDKIKVTHSSKNGFIDPELLHGIMTSVGESIVDYMPKDDGPKIKYFLNALKDEAIKSRGKRRATILSLLMEFGDFEIVNVVSSDDFATKSEIDRTANTGYYGFVSKVSQLKKQYGNNSLIEEKGRQILSSVLVPFVNIYTSGITRNMVQVDETGDYPKFSIDSKDSIGSVRGAIRSSVLNKMYDDDGFVSETALNKFKSEYSFDNNGSIGIFIGGEFTPLLVVDSISKTVRINEIPDVEKHLFTLLKAMGVSVREKTWNAFLESANNSKLDSLKNGYISELWSMAAGIFVANEVASNLSEAYDLLTEYEKDEVTEARRKEIIKSIKNTLTKNQNRYLSTNNAFGDSSGIDTMFGMLKHIYESKDFKFQTAIQGVTYGEGQEDLIDLMSENDVNLSPLAFAIPNILDNRRLISQLAIFEKQVIGDEFSNVKYNHNNDMVQTHVMGSQITELLTKQGRRLSRLISKMPITSILHDGKGVASLFSGVKNVFSSAYEKYMPILSIRTLADFDGFIGKDNSIQFNKINKGKVFKTLIDLGFVGSLLKSGNEFFSMLLTPHADKTNTRMLELQQAEGTQQLFRAYHNKAEKTTSVDINKPALVNAIFNNVQVMRRAQLDSLSKWVSVLNNYYGKQVVNANSSLDEINKLIPENIDDRFRNLSRRLINTYDYRIVKGKLVLGYAAMLNAEHSIYSNDFCQKIFDMQKSNASIDDVYNYIKSVFFGDFVDFVETLQEYGYQMPETYFNSLKSSLVKERKQEKELLKVNLDETQKGIIAKEIESLRQLETESNPDVSILKYVENFFSKEQWVSVADLSEDLSTDGKRNELGDKVASVVSSIISKLNNEKNNYGKQLKEIKKKYSSEAKANYYDLNDNLKWNPVFESFFFAYHLINTDVSKFTKGGLLYTKNLVDFIKRSAGESAPGSKLDVTVSNGIPPVIKNLVVDFGGDVHPWLLNNDGSLKYDKELRSNGQGLLNPIMAVMMQNSAGPEYGPVGSTMVKNVVHYHDFDSNNTVYMKQAMRRITATTIQMSRLDFALFKKMNLAIWNINYKDGMTYGQTFEKFRNGDNAIDFDKVVEDAVEMLSKNQALKSEIVMQAIDPSAIKTGLTAVYRLDEIVDSNGDLIEDMSEETIMKMIESGEIEYTDEEGKPCISFKAKDGARESKFTKGGKWEIVEDLTGYPSHKEGGVDISIGNDGVSFINSKNVSVKAANGLLLPKAQKGKVIPEEEKPKRVVKIVGDDIKSNYKQEDLDAIFDEDLKEITEISKHKAKYQYYGNLIEQSEFANNQKYQAYKTSLPEKMSERMDYANQFATQADNQDFYVKDDRVREILGKDYDDYAASSRFLQDYFNRQTGGTMEYSNAYGARSIAMNTDAGKLSRPVVNGKLIRETKYRFLYNKERNDYDYELLSHRAFKNPPIVDYDDNSGKLILIKDNGNTNLYTGY